MPPWTPSSRISEPSQPVCTISIGTEGRTPDQHDAYAIAAWLRQADLDDRLQESLNPSLTPSEHALAEVEG
ncbi:hypothetical protein [Halochromatium sp.]